ncbi:MAG: DUF2062 domain-containing protein [Rhodospirillales bacterium]
MAAWLWPRSGWRRASRYLLHRLSRLPGTPYSLAAGFAMGAAVSFTPLVGFHFVMGALLAWLMRANVLASIIGTAVGNPWTFPFIWLWLYSAGQWIMLKTGFITAAAAAAPRPAFHKVFAEMFHGAITGDWLHVADFGLPVIGPMLLVSVPTGLAVWLLMFSILKPVIERYQSARRSRRRRGRRSAVIRRRAAKQAAKQAAAQGGVQADIQAGGPPKEPFGESPGESPGQSPGERPEAA